MGTRKLNVMFYRPPDNDLLVNRLVAYVDGPYSHTELVFEDGKASSVFAGENVFLYNRSYSNPNYDIITLEVSQYNYNMAYAHCKHAMDSKVAFSTLAMYAAVMPWQLVPYDKGRTFCSHLVTEALMKANVCEVTGCNPMTMSPSKLYKTLSMSNRHNMIDTVLSRYSRIKT